MGKFRQRLIIFNRGNVGRIIFILLLSIFYVLEVDSMATTNSQKNTADFYIETELAKGRQANKLINEKSPYLLQHAFNPVNWYPWGDEAFSLARKENKPIFLSIGYSTCHWCHVMAHESFENEDIAPILNGHSISIKLDREERPDLDQVYMAVTLSMTGSSGWPMSVFLTPDLKPFYAGTYFPPEDRYGRPGFPKLLYAIDAAWQNDRDRILIQAQKILDGLAKQAKNESSRGPVSGKHSKQAANYFIENFDRENGGFGNYPKFPRPVVLNFLFRYAKGVGDKRVEILALETLRKMADGGVYDHVGGGFHRYSVDAKWRVPHFEKMLYDQAQLAMSYLEAYQLTGENEFERIARHTLDYVLREMADPKGGFYSAEDADSPLPENSEKKSEGAFYLWGKSEIYKRLPTLEADVFSFIYGIKENGNAPADPHGYFVNKNILYRAQSNKSASVKFEITEQQIRVLEEKARSVLLKIRTQRLRPHMDDKVLSSWNGLMISALAKGYHVLRDERYLEAALGAAQFIQQQMYDRKSKVLFHRYRNDDVGIEGQLDDYAFMVQGVLDLYEASFENRWLLWAMDLNEKQIELFYDKKEGGFFDSSGKDKSVLLRMKGDYDGSEPAGNSIAAMNLLRLARMTASEYMLEKGEGTVSAFAGQLAQVPQAMPQMLAAYEFMREKSMQIVIAGKRGAEDTKLMHVVTGKYFLPNKIIMLANLDDFSEEQVKKFSFLQYMSMVDNRATAYVCENFTCKQPTVDPEVLSATLAK